MSYPPSISRSWRRLGVGLPLLLLLCACGGGGNSQEKQSSSKSIDHDPELEAYQRSQKERAEYVDPNSVGIGERAPDLPFTTIDGKEWTLSTYADGKPLLVIVRDVSCPVSMRIGPRTAALDKTASELGAKVLYVNPCPHNSLAEIREEIANYGFQSPYVYDEKTTFMYALGITRTTEFLVYDPTLTLIYRGPIDDQIGRGINNITAPSHTFALDAVHAALEGELPEIQAMTAPGCVLAPEPEGEQALSELLGKAEGPTYHRDVARILQRRCVECHHAGGVGPFALDSYKQARGRRGMIELVIQDETMPPWFAADDTGPWRNNRSLTDKEKATLLTWIEAGGPEGDPREGPEPRDWHNGWGIGEPDVIVQLKEPFVVPAEGVVDLQELDGDMVTQEDMWVTAMQILPTAPSVVHHVVVLIREPVSAKGTANVIRESLAPWQKRRGGWEFLGGYLPGKGPRIYPEGAARFIPKGSRILFVMHYTPSGVETVDRTRFGFVTTDEVPDMVAQAYVMKNEDIVIPPGASNLPIEDEWTLPKDIRLWSLTPHMHLRGSRFFVYAQLPGQEEKRILELPRWDDSWQFSYTPVELPDYPAGTKFRVVGVYDNTPANMNLDPGDWDKEVVNGPQIWDEMLMLAVEWIAPKETIRRLQ